MYMHMGRCSTQADVFGSLSHLYIERYTLQIIIGIFCAYV